MFSFYVSGHINLVCKFSITLISIISVTLTIVVHQLNLSRSSEMEKSIDEEMMIFLRGESSDENENDENNHQSF